ncbi:hypothetical protein [Bifidobacterium sp.]|uniref:hypothetical protein n=1 Tax=Bifidobacterium sp. TaxID=41200 RepID=UPI0039E977EE
MQWVEIIGLVLGSQGLSGIVFAWIGRHSSVNQRLERIENDLREQRLTILRQCLFAHPYDQQSHMAAISSGDKYLELGGNGVGETRLAQLKANYDRRMREADWDYRHDRP